MSTKRTRAKAGAREAAEEALDDWEELFIAALHGGGADSTAAKPQAFVDWCDDVARAAQARIQRKRELAEHGNMP